MSINTNKTSSVNDLTIESLNNQYANINIANHINLTNLEKFIKDNFNIDCQFSIESVYETSIKISSNELLQQTGNIGKQMFTSIKLKTSIYRNKLSEIKENITNNELNKFVYIPINFRYEHPSGGSNGVNLGTGWIGYNFESEEWSINK